MSGLGVLILAAGKGSRLKSSLPKALFPLLEEPLLFYPLNNFASLGLPVGVLVGHEGEAVSSWVTENFPASHILYQKELLGTGHAVASASEWWRGFDSLLVLPADTPLLSVETLSKLINFHEFEHNDCTALSFITDEPHGYGRIVRSKEGIAIVEEKDASEGEKKITECNSGVYIFDVKLLLNVINSISNDNAQNEYYLTDALPLIRKAGGRVGSCLADDADEVMGINDTLQLAHASRLMRDRILRAHMRRGAKCMDMQSVWIGPKVSIGDDVWIEPGVQMWGRCVIGASCRIGSYTVLTNCALGSGVKITGPVRFDDSTFGDGVTAGPFTVVRNDAVIKDEAYLGKFVEVKKSVIGAGSKVPHLSYVGDTEMGKNTNIGAGTVTCNYDGVQKNKTIIGDDCFIGSDTMLVAPVSVGDGAVTGAGSVITKDVPPGALGIAREKQTNIENWHTRKLNKQEKKEEG